MSTSTPKADAFYAEAISAQTYLHEGNPFVAWHFVAHDIKDFARTVERELAAARAEVERLERALIEQTIEADTMRQHHANAEKCAERAEAEVVKLRAELEGQKSLCDELENLNTSHCEVIAKLRADKERMDWLEQSTFYPISATGESVRAAIDAARAKGAT